MPWQEAVIFRGDQGRQLRIVGKAARGCSGQEEIRKARKAVGEISSQRGLG